MVCFEFSCPTWFDSTTDTEIKFKYKPDKEIIWTVAYINATSVCYHSMMTYYEMFWILYVKLDHIQKYVLATYV